MRAWWHHMATWICGNVVFLVMAFCLTAPSHYLNQCWLIITRDTPTIKIELKFSLYIRFNSNLPGTNELKVNEPGDFITQKWTYLIYFRKYKNISTFFTVSRYQGDTCYWNTSSKQMRARLTHWGRVTHICVSELTSIGSDNGLSPGRRQAIIWTNAWILLIGPLGTNFSEILIEILTFSFMKMCLKVSSAKWRPFCLGLNVLTYVANIRDADDLETKGTDHHQSWYWYPGIFRPQYQKDQYVAAEEMLLRCSECYIFMNYKSASSFTNATFKCASEPGPLFTKR